MTVIEDSGFVKRREGLLDDDCFFEPATYLINAPGAGQLIPRTGGLRKIRWTTKGRGKRGGLRIIYYWQVSDEVILFLDVYAKSDKEDLTQEELRKLAKKI